MILPDHGSVPVILPDRLAPGLMIVFCGTAAGTASARRGAYYAGPGNRFWPLLAQCGFTPRRLAPEESGLLPGMGLGLTDLSKTAFGPDATIRAGDYDGPGLIARINAVRPRALAFTSLTAARLALGRPKAGPGMLAPDDRLPGVELWALPSPSGAARGSFSAAPWQALADRRAQWTCTG